MKETKDGESSTSHPGRTEMRPTGNKMKDLMGGEVKKGGKKKARAEIKGKIDDEEERKRAKERT